MNTTDIKTDWKELKGTLKQKYGQLTDDDLVFSEGVTDELLAKLEKKLGKTKEVIRKEIMEMTENQTTSKTQS